MVSVYRKIMMMQIKNGLCLMWLFVLMLLFAACSHRQKGDESWHKDIDEFVSGHQSLMQSHPDSMIMLIRNFKCEGNPDKSDQWKKLLIAKCYYMKGADAQCQSLIDSVNAYCKQTPDNRILSYADNLQGILLLVSGKRKEALNYYEKAYHEIMNLDSCGEAIDVCINIADASRQMGKLADASSWYRRAYFLADSLNQHEAQNSILSGLGQVYNDLQNYQLAHHYFQKAERLYPPKNPKDVHFFYNSWGNVYSSQENRLRL